MDPTTVEMILKYGISIIALIAGIYLGKKELKKIKRMKTDKDLKQKESNQNKIAIIITVIIILITFAWVMLSLS